ncbi:MAG: DUF4263 domain-containing protein [Rickettsiales bacterium]|nr:DUF4263 domain-containing protein [Rickettsiales bacterium]
MTNNRTKEYFDLVDEKNDISCLTIKNQVHSNGQSYDCKIVDKEGIVYKGFKISESEKGSIFIVCDVSFQKSGDRHEPRLTFRKTNQEFETNDVKPRLEVIIAMTTSQTGHRKLWLMIDFLNKWRAVNNEGKFTDYFAITARDSESMLSKISHLENKDIILQGLQKLSSDQLSNIDNWVDITEINNLLKKWKENDQNNDEVGFWQQLFIKNSRILSQVFAIPLIQKEDNYYCGGKTISNTGGVYGDFLYKNLLTNNIAFIEIKTPKTPLVLPGLYRGKNDDDANAIYSIDQKLTGSVNQVLNQRNVFVQYKYPNLAIDMECTNCKCVVIAGRIQDLSKGQKKSFEMYRNSLRDVEIITYDELYNRINYILDLLK